MIYSVVDERGWPLGVYKEVAAGGPVNVARLANIGDHLVPSLFKRGRVAIATQGLDSAGRVTPIQDPSHLFRFWNNYNGITL